jgi:DNA-binding NtrC family response regulator
MSSSRHILFFPSPHHFGEPDSIAEAASFEMVGDGDAMRRLHLQVKRIGPHFRTVLIRGELGTGKELAARALHRASEGAGSPFVVCNAASLEDATADGTILEWLNDLMVAASKGTLFLDGIEEIPMVTQSRLLAALRKKACRRIIASTTEDLRLLAASGKFRQDLYHYVATVEIVVEPLRERREDIPPLAEYFLRRFSTLYGRRIYGIADDGMERLLTHAWPGNVRELENVIRNGVLQCEGTVLRAGDLTSLCEMNVEVASTSTIAPARLQDVVNEHVQRVLKSCSGNKVKAAEVLGISRSTLYRMLESRPAAR